MKKITTTKTLAEWFIEEERLDIMSPEEKNKANKELQESFNRILSYEYIPNPKCLFDK